LAIEGFSAPLAHRAPNLFLYTTRGKLVFDVIKWAGTMSRPKMKDREKVKERVNVSLHRHIKKKAAKIGGGNVSRGIEIAVANLAKEQEGENDVARA
jgi:hypothetical protein